MDRDIEPMESRPERDQTPLVPKPFGAQILFDLTAFETPTGEGSPGVPEAPEVYVLAQSVAPPPRTGFPWGPTLGLVSILFGGVGLGLLLARLLLWG